MIQLLKETSLYERDHFKCGDGCCAWDETGERETLPAGAEIDEYSYFCDDLIEGEDYIQL